MTRAAVKDWRTLPDSQEKRHVYMASREWALLKKALRARSKGVCERCQFNKPVIARHQTFERLYREKLEDLLFVCEPCHDFLIAKRPSDPVLEMPVRVCGRDYKRVYMAGAIRGSVWRDTIFPGWSCLREDFWIHTRHRVPVPYTGNKSLRYAGPFAADYEPSKFRPLDSLPLTWKPQKDHRIEHLEMLAVDENRREAFSSMVDCIVFAWIDTTACPDALYEIGQAVAKDALVVVGLDRELDERGQFDDLWPAIVPAYLTYQGATPDEAWGTFWSHTLGITDNLGQPLDF